ncbi:MAG: hypothetical protein LBO09_04200 [Candidatus Peribacteria bacterium]|jgi:hypothetical protein|nr:hypothetical protein [Candidatus Peribacteria bacterium]
MKRILLIANLTMREDDVFHGTSDISTETGNAPSKIVLTITGKEISSVLQRENIMRNRETVARVDELANEYHITGNTLSKMKQLNLRVEKHTNQHTPIEEKIYQLKDDMILEYLLKKEKVITYKGMNTTVHIRQ